MWGSRWAAGSSSSSNGASCRKARARAMRCACPAQPYAALADRGGVFLGQLLDELIGMRQAGGLLDLFQRWPPGAPGGCWLPGCP